MADSYEALEARLRALKAHPTTSTIATTTTTAARSEADEVADVLARMQDEVALEHGHTPPLAHHAAAPTSAHAPSRAATAESEDDELADILVRLREEVHVSAKSLAADTSPHATRGAAPQVGRGAASTMQPSSSSAAAAAQLVAETQQRMFRGEAEDAALAARWARMRGESHLAASLSTSPPHPIDTAVAEFLAAAKREQSASSTTTTTTTTMGATTFPDDWADSDSD